MSPTLSPVVDSHCPAYPATPWPHGLPQSAHLDPAPGTTYFTPAMAAPPVWDPTLLGWQSPAFSHWPAFQWPHQPAWDLLRPPPPFLTSFPGVARIQMYNTEPTLYNDTRNGYCRAQTHHRCACAQHTPAAPLFSAADLPRRANQRPAGAPAAGDHGAAAHPPGGDLLGDGWLGAGHAALRRQVQPQGLDLQEAG